MVTEPLSTSCVVIVPSARAADQGFEDALADLAKRYPVWRAKSPAVSSEVRNRMVADALARGYTEFLLLDPTVVFSPNDVERLRAHDIPMVCGIYPELGRRNFACELTPTTTSLRFGRFGGLVEALSCGLGFALIRRGVFDALSQGAQAGAEPAYFTGEGQRGDAAFCARVRAAAIGVFADTSIRLWRTGPGRWSWEDVAGDRERSDDFTLSRPVRGAQSESGAVSSLAVGPDQRAVIFRPPAAPLAPGFPRIRLYVLTYPENAASLGATLQSVRASDWGEDPVVVCQPPNWPKSRESGARNRGRALERAALDGCDFALLFEDDVRACRHLRYNLLNNPLVYRDQCDYLSLFIPDLIADPWERQERHLSYRLARPRFVGPDRHWEQCRVWGAQAYLLSRRFVSAAVARWGQLSGGQDARTLSVCAEAQVPLWYTAPCLVEHAPHVSAFGTPTTYAPDFDPEFRLEVGPGFQPPEAVPGSLTIPEAELLWRTASGLDVLELGTQSGCATVCLAQRANRVTTVDAGDQSEATEWVGRFGVADRVAFVRGDVGTVCRGLTATFGLVFVDTRHDAASVERDIVAALPLLTPGGLLAFHHYPNPGWPGVRRAVDDHVRRRGWRRVAQADFLGVFRT